jgi:hypothetical protein
LKWLREEAAYNLKKRPLDPRSGGLSIVEPKAA